MSHAVWVGEKPDEKPLHLARALGLCTSPDPPLSTSIKMDGSTYVRAQMLIDGLHSNLREIDSLSSQVKSNVEQYEEPPISSRWQELRSKFKSVEKSSSASAIPRSPLSHAAINDITNNKPNLRESRASPAKKPTNSLSSRQPVTFSEASPISQRTSVLNNEAERLLQRVRSMSSSNEENQAPQSSIWPSSQNQPKLTRPVLPPSRPKKIHSHFDEDGMLSQLELQLTMQKLLEGAAIKADHLEVAADVAALIQAEREDELRKQEIEAAWLRLQEEEQEEKEIRRGHLARLCIFVKRWRTLSESNRRRRAITVRAIHLRRLLPFLNRWLKAVEDGKMERVEAEEEARRGKIADKFRRLFMLNAALAAWRELVAEGGMREHEEAQMRLKEEMEEKEMAAKEILAVRFHLLFILHNSVQGWQCVAKEGKEERERLKLEALRKERIASLLSRIAKDPSQNQMDVAASEPPPLPIISLTPPQASCYQAANAPPAKLSAQLKRPPSATTKPCAPRLSTALRAEERKKSILSAATALKQPLVAIRPSSPVATLVIATPTSLEVTHQTTPGKTYAIIRSMKKQLRQGGPGAAQSQEADSSAAAEPWAGAYHEASEAGGTESKPSSEESHDKETFHPIEMLPRPNACPRTSSSSVSSVLAPSSFGGPKAVLKAPSFDPRPPVGASRRTSTSSIASSRSDLGSICSSASAMEKRREVEEALVKAKALDAKRRRQMTAQLLEVEGAFEQEASALSSLHYHRSLLIRALSQWKCFAALRLHEQPILAARHYHRSLMMKSLYCLSSAARSRRWQQVVHTAVGIASLRLSQQKRMAKKCILAFSQWALVSRFSRHHSLRRAMDSLHLMVAISREKAKVANRFHTEMIQRLSFISWRQAAEEQGAKRMLANLQAQHEQQRKADHIVLAYCFKRWRAGLTELRVDRQALQRAHSMRSKVNGWLQEMRAKRTDTVPADIDLL